MQNDIKNALASLSKSPGYVFAAALTLALGIGANTAIFSVINDVLLRDLPYAESERIAMVWEHNTQRDRPMNVVSPANFIDWRERNHTFTQLAGFFDRSFTLTGEGDPEDVAATAVTANLFSILGVNAQLGRVISAEDEKPESPRAVVLSNKYWRERFGADPSVIGRKLNLTGQVGNIVGVMPPDFGFYVKEASFNGKPPAFWVQARFDASDRVRTGRYMGVLGQLKPGITIGEARADMKTLARSLAAEYQDFNKNWGINVVPLREQFTGEIRPALFVVFGAVCLTLFIACANVVNLQLVRASGRAREFTVRAALGASRARLIRFLLTENALLGLLGGALGLALSRASLAGLQQLMPPDLLPGEYIGLDLRVLAFTFGISLITALLFGLIPAVVASNPHLAEALKEGSRGSTSARGRSVRQVFVAAQVGVAVMVLIGAGLLVRSFDHLVSTPPGFDPTNLLTARVLLPGSSYKEPEKIQAFYEQLLARVKSLPGVTAATGNVFAPFGGPGSATSFEVVGQPAAIGEKPTTDVRIVAADYFETLRIPIILGRTFSRDEIAQKRDVVVITEALARKHFAGQNPIGQKLTINMGPTIGATEVIGVVGDIRHQSLDQPAREMIYWPHSELPIGMMTIMMRTTGDPQQMAPSLQREVWAIDHNLPVGEVRSMEQLMQATVVKARFATLLFSLFAALALVLAALGIYGVVSYKVALETRDIGVRMALGANRGRILTEILVNGSRLAVAGIACGMVGSIFATRALASQLYEVSRTDPATFAAVPLVLMIVTVAACWLPARRAAGLEPIMALREE